MSDSLSYHFGKWIGITCRNFYYSFVIFREAQKNRNLSDYLNERKGDISHISDELNIHRLNVEHIKKLCYKLDSSIDWKEHGYWNSKLSQALRDSIHWTEDDSEKASRIREERRHVKTLEIFASPSHDVLPHHVSRHFEAIEEDVEE